MKIISEVSLREFEAWGGAVETKERIIKEGKEKELEECTEDTLYEPLGFILQELFENGIDLFMAIFDWVLFTTLNDAPFFTLNGGVFA